jgi:hypothetical protein
MHKLEDLKGLDHKIEYILILVFELSRLATDEVSLLSFAMLKTRWRIIFIGDFFKITLHILQFYLKMALTILQ